MGRKSCQEGLLKPEKVLRIGYVGHTRGYEASRRIKRTDDEIVKDVKQVLEWIRESLPGLLDDEQSHGLFADGEWRLEGNGGMAFGADCMVAETLVDAGIKVELIDANTADDQDEQKKEARDKLKARKNKTTHIVLDFEGNVAAHEALLLARSDLLLAIWDGEPGSSTARAIQNASDRGVPVIWIHAVENDLPSLYDSGKEPTRLDQNKNTLEASIKASVLPAAKIIDNKALRMCLAGHNGGEISNWLWGRLYRLSQGEWSKALALPFPRSKGKGSPAWQNEEKDSPILQRQKLLDSIASNMSNRYRVSVFGLYLFSAFAVFWAAAGYIWAEEFHHLAVEYAHGLPVAGLSEIAIIIAIIGWYWWGNYRAWHGQWLGARYTTEMLRMHGEFLDPVLGVASFMLPSRRVQRNWASWLCRRLLLSTPLGERRVDQADINSSLEGMQDYLKGQIGYHNGKAKSLARRYRLLHYSGLALFGLTFIAAVAHVFLHHHPGPLLQTLTLITIFFPAMGAALHAIMVQEELHKLKRVSEDMAEQLERYDQQLKQHREGEVAQLRSIMVEAAELMAGEASDWHELVKEKELELPA